MNGAHSERSSGEGQYLSNTRMHRLDNDGIELSGLAESRGTWEKNNESAFLRHSDVSLSSSRSRSNSALQLFGGAGPGTAPLG